MRGCKSGCGENSNELTYSVKDKELMSSCESVSFSGWTFLCDIGCYCNDL